MRCCSLRSRSCSAIVPFSSFWRAWASLRAASRASRALPAASAMAGKAALASAIGFSPRAPHFAPRRALPQRPRLHGASPRWHAGVPRWRQRCRLPAGFRARCRRRSWLRGCAGSRRAPRAGRLGRVWAASTACWAEAMLDSRVSCAFSSARWASVRRRRMRFAASRAASSFFSVDSTLDL